MLTFIAKPTSFQCNIHCEYCFYLNRKDVVAQPERTAIAMDDSTLSAFIMRMFTETQQQDVYFTWQGGEPTLAGLAFFQRVVAFQQQWQQKLKKKAHNALQTNGILLNDLWGAFLKQHQFLVGISIDGDRELHDAYRVNNAGKGTWKQVMQGIRVLKRHNVEFNILATVNNINVQHPLRTYRFLKGLGSQYLQFTPVIETGSGEQQLPSWRYDEAIIPVTRPFSVPVGQYGRFICAIFNDWLYNDIGQIHIQLVDSLLARFCGFSSQMCIWQPRCGGENLALERNGDVYQCDHLVYRNGRIGNIHDLPLAEIAGKAQWLSTEKQRLNKQCTACDWRELCHGGCPKHRFVLNQDGEKHNYFCADYQAIFRYLTPAMNFMAQTEESGLPLESIRPYLQKIGYPPPQ